MSDLLIPVTEDDILQILASKHTRDLFFPHCKTGPSWFATGQLILDGWVMPMSWTKPIIGYEVKVSRSDFRRDHKWCQYLEFCNVFYFVCPWGLLEAKDVPEQAGLIWTTKTGSGIRYLKKSPLRCYHQIPQSIFQYVLMWRRDNRRVDGAEMEDAPA
jgi:hypothetical protein